MGAEWAASFFKGFGTSLGLSSPVEWGVHKYLLHAKPESRRKIKFIDEASYSHHDNHHAAYKGPAHYYRDITNEKEVIHFSKTDVGVIAGIAAFVGGVIDAGYSLIAKGGLELEVNDAAFVSGVVGGTMIYYGYYEFIHHYMHVIGKRRLEINRVLGDEIQGGKKMRDGKLRLSKPLLDDICNEVEHKIDTAIRNDKGDADFFFEENLVQRLHEQIAYNGEDKNGLGMPAISPIFDRRKILDTTTHVMLERERNYRGNLREKEKIKSWMGRKVQSFLRSSSIFKYLDNHHFFHHFKYGKNLNVVLPLADYALRTKMDSSEAVLEENKKYWLCPNSPDVEAFKVKKPKLYQKAGSVLVQNSYFGKDIT